MSLDIWGVYIYYYALVIKPIAMEDEDFVKYLKHNLIPVLYPEGSRCFVLA